jgi:hypothetical protein
VVNAESATEVVVLPDAGTDSAGEVVVVYDGKQHYDTTRRAGPRREGRGLADEVRAPREPDTEQARSVRPRTGIDAPGFEEACDALEAAMDEVEEQRGALRGGPRPEEGNVTVTGTDTASPRGNEGANRKRPDPPGAGAAEGEGGRKRTRAGDPGRGTPGVAPVKTKNPETNGSPAVGNKKRLQLTATEKMSACGEDPDDLPEEAQTLAGPTGTHLLMLPTDALRRIRSFHVFQWGFRWTPEGAWHWLDVTSATLFRILRNADPPVWIPPPPAPAWGATVVVYQQCGRIQLSESDPNGCDCANWGTCSACGGRPVRLCANPCHAPAAEEPEEPPETETPEEGPAPAAPPEEPEHWCGCAAGPPCNNRLETPLERERGMCSDCANYTCGQAGGDDADNCGLPQVSPPAARANRGERGAPEGSPESRADRNEAADPEAPTQGKRNRASPHKLNGNKTGMHIGIVNPIGKPPEVQAPLGPGEPQEDHAPLAPRGGQPRTRAQGEAANSRNVRARLHEEGFRQACARLEAHRDSMRTAQPRARPEMPGGDAAGEEWRRKGEGRKRRKTREETGGPPWGPRSAGTEGPRKDSGPHSFAKEKKGVG